jgi:hypothetical protein
MCDYPQVESVAQIRCRADMVDVCMGYDKCGDLLRHETQCLYIVYQPVCALARPGINQNQFAGINQVYTAIHATGDIGAAHHVDLLPDFERAVHFRLKDLLCSIFPVLSD